MDWKKTKNQIILILLILNLSLLGLYLKDKKDLSPYKNPEGTIKILEEKLDQAGIKLATTIPKDQVKEKPLLVKYQEESIPAINQNYFKGQGDIDIRENITTITKDQEEITIINNRRFLYENYKNQDDPATSTDKTKDNSPTDSVSEETKGTVPSGLSPAEATKTTEKQKTKGDCPSGPVPDEATTTPESKTTENQKEKALAFLEEKAIDTSDMVLANIIEEKETTTYEFLKTYKDKILETSYLRLSLERGQVTKMDRLWIQVIQEEKDKIQIEPAYKALFALLNQEDLKGKTIEEIKVCYYFNPEEQGLLEDNTKAEQGRAIPAWRIKFTDGTTKILDNF